MATGEGKVSAIAGDDHRVGVGCEFWPRSSKLEPPWAGASRRTPRWLRRVAALVLADSGLDSFGLFGENARMNTTAPEPLITLTSDFGTRDGYAGAMKGVIRSVAPHVRVEDITHEVPAGDIRAGAWALRSAVPFFPRGTVHVAVIDPGVGTARNAVVLLADGQYLIGPDNGLFSWIIRESREVRAWKLSSDSWRPAQGSYTFHGRDLFAHAAALMVQEGEVDRICGEVLRPHCGEWAKAMIVEEEAEGEVVHVDAFGNVITNLVLNAESPETAWRVDLPESPLHLEGLDRTYGDVETGEGLALIGSHQFLEVAVRQGSAAERFGIRVGDPVRVRMSHG